MLELKIDDKNILLFNQYSGTIALVFKEWYASMSVQKKERWLAKNNLILSLEKRQEYFTKQQLYLQNYRKKRGLFAYISPTFSCPMGCSYCFQKSVKSCCKKLSKKQIPKIMEVIQQQIRKNDLTKATIVLFGGEPLLLRSFDFNKSLIETAISKKYKIKIVTSGVTINDHYISLLKKYSSSIIDLDITIDGPPNIHNILRPLGQKESFDIIARNIDLLLEKGLNVTAKTNIGYSNFIHLSELIKIYKEKKWIDQDNFKIAFNFVRNHGQIDDNQETVGNNIIFDIYNLIKNNNLYHKATIDSVRELSYFAHCFLDKNLFEGGARVSFCNPDNSTTISISPSGEIFPCNWMVGKSDYSIGTVDGGLSNNESNLFIDTQCANCKIFSLCGGGCMIDRTKDGYYNNCYQKNINLFQTFIQKIVEKENIYNYKIIKKEFEW